MISTSSTRIAAAVVALPLVVALSQAAAAAGSRPNVVVIVADDLGYHDVGVHGCTDCPTPHIDSIAAGGVRCTSGYVSGPYCSPTRAGLLTGRYQTRFGHEFNPGPATAADENFGLPLDQVTLADRLKKLGYSTGMVGKWHLGYLPQFRPQKRGFDEFFGFLGGAHSYIDAKADGANPILRGNEPVDEKEYLTDAFAREAEAFIEKNKANPFFLYLAFNAVHTPMQADDPRLKKFASIEDKTRRTYAAMMSAMDDGIGRVIAKLQATDLTKNTLIMFISDNGGPTMPGVTINGSINKPLRGSKRTTLEGGIRVPFFVKWPGQLAAGKVYEQPVIQIDILPTALAAAGIDLAENDTIEGLDLLPFLRGNEESAPHEALYWRFGRQMAIRQGDWKLVRYDATVDGMRGQIAGPKLYNLADDVGENNDLMEKEPDKAAALQAKWDEWNESNVPALWGGDGRGRGRRNAANRQPAEAPTP